MKILTYCGALLLSIVLVNWFIKTPDTNPYDSSPVSKNVKELAEANDNPSSTGALPATGSPIHASSSSSFSEVSEAKGASLIIGDKLLSLGENVDSLIAKLGIPGRIADTEYNFEFYVYNRDYRYLLFVAVKDGLIEGFYTDSLLFNFMGISSGSNLQEISRVLGSTPAPKEIIPFETEEFKASILMDQADTGLVTGIYVLSSNVIETGYDESVMKDAELLSYDLANSLRIRNGLPAFSWSSTAAKASRKHSKDMAMKNYFDHVSLDGRLPGDRLQEEGVLAQRVGENIIAGYGSAILNNHAWFNSPGHRRNLLNPDFISLGVGFIYDDSSTYQTYMTQIFYR